MIVRLECPQCKKYGMVCSKKTAEDDYWFCPYCKCELEEDKSYAEKESKEDGKN